MSIKEARTIAKNALISGYHHHPYNLEKQITESILKGAGDIVPEDITSLRMYADILAPTHLRGMKNTLICFITILSRSAIELGVSAEQSFALSDYYINLVELQNDERELEKLFIELLEMFREMVSKVLHGTYSLPVMRAIRYINQHIYESCRVSTIAKHLSLNPQYLSTIFKNEVGVDPSTYIRNKKMEEAKSLLYQTNNSVSEIAEALGYCNTSHFISTFKKTYGQTPAHSMKPNL